jgi:hypothetical protein
MMATVEWVEEAVITTTITTICISSNCDIVVILAIVA